MLKKVIFLGVLAFLGGVLTAKVAFAGDSSSGCGLGWQVLPKQSLVSSFTRAMINTTFSNSIAMTLGTSGCAKHSIVYNEKQGIHFVEANKEVLVAEMALGSGEYISAMAEVFNCQDSSAFGKMIQKNYSSIVTSEDVSGVELYQNIKNIPELQNTCIII